MMIDSRTIGSWQLSLSEDTLGYHIEVYNNGKLDEDLSDTLHSKETAQVVFDNIVIRTEMLVKLKL